MFFGAVGVWVCESMGRGFEGCVNHSIEGSSFEGCVKQWVEVSRGV